MNEVQLAGKVSRVGRLAYTPSGIALAEFTLAVAQKTPQKNSMGYFEIVLMAALAEELAPQLKIGKQISVKGNLWGRKYKDRQGNQVSETKILASELGGDLGRQSQKSRG